MGRQRNGELPASTRAYLFLRSHVLGVVAIFVALTGTAVATSAGDGPRATNSAGSAKQIKKLKQQLTTVETRLAALEGSQGAARAPTGGAGGDLTGSYPNPLIGLNAVGTGEVDGTLTGNDIVESSLGIVPDADALDGIDSAAFGYGLTTASFDPDETGTLYAPGIGSTTGVVSPVAPVVDVMIADAPMRIRDLRMEVDVAPGAGNSWSLDLIADGTTGVAGISCGFVGASTSCTAAGPSDPIPAGTRLAMQLTGISGPAAASLAEIAFRYGPA